MDPQDFGIIYLVAGLTLLWAIAAIGIATIAPSRPTLFTERLFETFLSLTASGFFTVLGLVASLHGR